MTHMKKLIEVAWPLDVISATQAAQLAHPHRGRHLIARSCEHPAPTISSRIFSRATAGLVFVTKRLLLPRSDGKTHPRPRFASLVMAHALDVCKT